MANFKFKDVSNYFKFLDSFRSVADNLTGKDKEQYLQAVAEFAMLGITPNEEELTEIAQIAWSGFPALIDLYSGVYDEVL